MSVLFSILCFFFSSRRRHTRFDCDWSSDVCSSDLVTHGTDGIIPCGTTGESPTLSHGEHKRVVEVVLEAARGRIKVVPGTGSYSTAEAGEVAPRAQRPGARRAAGGHPFYKKPHPARGLRHLPA